MYVYVALLFTLIDCLCPPPRSFFALGGRQLEYHNRFFKLVEKHCVLIYDKKVEKLDNKVESWNDN